MFGLHTSQAQHLQSDDGDTNDGDKAQEGNNIFRVIVRPLNN